MKLIDKDALVAKIERRIKTNKECMLGLRNLDYYQGKVDALNDTISSLDTLEAKEVDLEKEVEDYWHNSDLSWCRDAYSMTHIRTMLSSIAKHFFELGLRCSQTDDSYIEGVKGSYTTTDKD